MVVGDYNGHVGLGVKCAKEVSLLTSRDITHLGTDEERSQMLCEVATPHA